jgi:putative Mg2+ transporter-C (MgtC) family protein
MLGNLDLVMVVRLLLASLLGGLIGLEREIHGRPAGFRTHLLVSLGSCLFVVTSIEFYEIYGNFSGTGPVGVDPGRVAAQVVTGIGFLGAGAIIREKASIRGLTTAACLWIAAALGVACGVGLHGLAAVVTLVALANLLLLKKLELRLHKDTYYTVKVWGDDSTSFMSRIEAALAGYRLKPLRTRFDRDVERQHLYVEFQVKQMGKETSSNLLVGLAALEGVKRIRLE